MQIAAVNNTIANNLYMPYVENGKLSLRNASLANQNSQTLCIVFNDSQRTDVSSYLLQIETRLDSVRGRLQQNTGTAGREELQARTNQYVAQAEYLKFLLQNPCQFSQPQASAASQSGNSTAPALESSQKLNYIGDGSKLSSNNCADTVPYLVNGQCTACVSPTPQYDIASSKCTSCPSGKYFSERTHACENI